MGFAQEVRDFTAGYTAITDAGNKKKGLALDEKRIDADIEYKEATIELQRQRLDMEQERFKRGLASASAAAERNAEKAKTAGFDAMAASPAPTAGTPPASASPTLTFGVPTAAIPETPAFEHKRWDGEFGEPVPQYRGGGPVSALEEDPTQPMRSRWTEYFQDEQNAAIPTEAPALPTSGAPRLERTISNTMQTGRDVSPQVQNVDAMIPQDTPAMPPRPSAIPDARAADAPPEDPRGPGRDALERPKPKPVPPSQRASEIIVARSSEAGRMVLDGTEQRLKFPQAAVGEGSEEPAADLITGKGALTPAEIGEIYKTVDPNGTIPEYLRSSMALAEAYTYFRDRGENEKAYNIATKILAGEKQLTQVLGTLAMEAFQNGNVEEALSLFGDVSQHFPSGHEIFIAPDANGELTYTVREYGEVVDQGRLSGADFMELAGMAADGRLFMKTLTQFAAANKPVDTKKASTEAINTAAETAAQALYDKQYAEAMLAAAAAQGDVPEEEIAAWEERAAEATDVWQAARSSAINDYGAKRTDFDATVKPMVRAIDTDTLMYEPPPQPERIIVGDDGGTGGDGGGADLPEPKTKAERDALPPGTRYRAPDGTVWTKQ